MTVGELLNAAGQRILRRDAETLLAHTLGRDRAWLFAHSGDEVEHEGAGTFLRMVARRIAGEPMQYIQGEQEFYGLRLRVTPATLIPRPETEHLVEAVLAWVASDEAGTGKVRQPYTIVDVGTGTGAIALALATHLPMAEVTACDLSVSALAVARGNAVALGLAARVGFIESDLLAFADDAMRFDVVVSNPPYVPAGDAATMQREVVEHEPHGALFAGEDGLAVYRRLVPQAHTVLRSAGLLAMEIGYGQRAAIAALLAGWSAVRFLDDYAGIARVVLAERV